ncbi:unnamed protein product [Zymoseptoria tritici ST99CH_1A5]|uniref:Granulins domain-containing protein n=3 Tax=Zymoseptoria tritici TaxID=1047171 RepID=A0A1X7RZM9_ZYMT9|nr:unnamed protein product [Zymoseptoria tritici ST99CH_3D7]SMR55483.1 unnamed protein product [Zymoseptoria tritici ST99CH_1E4]SMR57857.1 unnamed protein product [Zymoseptoria tritici ST99CH_3D1]SMY26293.1 unnamed protein product [Zymoseptoria tritici ST99CH_1A5]
MKVLTYTLLIMASAALGESGHIVSLCIKGENSPCYGGGICCDPNQCFGNKCQKRCESGGSACPSGWKCCDDDEGRRYCTEIQGPCGE